MANISAEIHMRDSSYCAAKLFSPKLGNSELTFATVAINAKDVDITRAVIYFTSVEQVREFACALRAAEVMLAGYVDAESGCV